MRGNLHVPCGAGEKLEIASNAYLLLTNMQFGLFLSSPFLSTFNQLLGSFLEEGEVPFLLKL